MQNFENLTEKQVESREIFDGYIMHVFKDTVELPNGKLAPREYMRHVGAVCVVPLLDDGSVLLERQFRYPVGKVLMEIPAGQARQQGRRSQKGSRARASGGDRRGRRGSDRAWNVPARLRLQ